MKNYKLVFLLLIIFTCNVQAKEKVIDEIYMNAEVDILGSIHVKEAIITDEKDLTIPIVYKPYTTKQTKEKIEGTTLYNAHGLTIKCAKSFRSDNTSFKLLDKSCTDSKNFKVTEKNDRKIISIKREKNNNVYLLDYFIDQALVSHKDISELFFPFISDYDYDINKANIQVVLSGYTSDFKFYSHSNGKGELTPIGEKKNKKTLYKGVILKLKDIPADTTTDVRLLFNKNITGISEKLINKSNQNAFDRIVKLEEKKISDTNKKHKIQKMRKSVSISLIVGYLVLGLILLWYFIKEKVDKNTLLFYVILGILILIFCIK